MTYVCMESAWKLWVEIIREYIKLHLNYAWHAFINHSGTQSDERSIENISLFRPSEGRVFSGQSIRALPVYCC